MIIYWGLHQKSCACQDAKLYSVKISDSNPPEELQRQYIRLRSRSAVKLRLCCVCVGNIRYGICRMNWSFLFPKLSWSSPQYSTTVCGWRDNGRRRLGTKHFQQPDLLPLAFEAAPGEVTFEWLQNATFFANALPEYATNHVGPFAAGSCNAYVSFGQILAALTTGQWYLFPLRVRKRAHEVLLGQGTQRNN